MKKVALIIVVSTLLGACATIINGVNQKIKVHGEEGMLVKLNDVEVREFPSKVKVRRSKHLTVEISKEGYLTESKNYHAILSPAIFLNSFLLFTTNRIDVNNGAGLKYPVKRIKRTELIKLKNVSESPVIVCNEAYYRLMLKQYYGLLGGSDYSYSHYNWSSVNNSEVKGAVDLINKQLNELGFSVSGYYKRGEKSLYSSKGTQFILNVDVSDIVYRVSSGMYADSKPLSFCKVKTKWKLIDKKTKKEILVHTVNTDYNQFDEEINEVILKTISRSLHIFLAENDVVDILEKYQSTNELSYSTSENENDEEPVLEIDIVTDVKPQAYVDLVSRIQESVLNIKTSKGFGSGFIISKDGYALTNAHVVGNEKEVDVRFYNGFSSTASVIRLDEDLDVALLKIDLGGLKAAPIDVDYTVRLGEDVSTIGTPVAQQLEFTLSKGIISGKRNFEDFSLIQMNMNVNPGNSGGPLFTNDGKVIGIIKSKIVGNAIEGIGFAIPINDALESMNIEIK